MKSSWPSYIETRDKQPMGRDPDRSSGVTTTLHTCIKLFCSQPMGGSGEVRQEDVVILRSIWWMVMVAGEMAVFLVVSGLNVHTSVEHRLLTYISVSRKVTLVEEMVQLNLIG